MNRLRSPAVLVQTLLTGILSVFLVSSPLALGVSQALAEAKLAQEAGAYAAAAESLRRAQALLPWRDDLLPQSAQLSLQAGDAASAVRDFTQAAQAAPLPAESLLALGDAYLALGETEQAVGTWQQIPGTDGYAEAALLRLLELHRSQRDYAQAAEDLKSLLRLHPSLADYSYQLGLLLAVLEPDAALAHLSQAAQGGGGMAAKANALLSRLNTARLYDEPAYTSLSVGRWLGSQGEWSLALLAFQQAVAQRPDYAEAWAYLGEALQQTQAEGASAAGLAELQTALELDPASIAASLLVSLYWQRQGEYEKARETLESAAAHEPENPYLQAELGRVSAGLGDLPTAQSYYEQAVALAPTEPLFWRLLAQFSLDRQLQVRQLALPAARTALLLAPQDAQSLDLLGKTLLALGDLFNAERFLRRAIAADAAYAPAHLHLGMLYLNRGEQVLAQAEFQAAEHLDPGAQMADQIERLDNYYFP